VEHVDATERTFLDRHEALIERALDEDVVGRRRVVVTVPDVAAANDPSQLRHVH